MKRIGCLLGIVMLSFILVGCQEKTKENVNVTNISDVLEEYNFTVTDVTSKFGYATVAYFASNDDIEINFVQGEKKYDIQGIFLDECTNAYEVMGSNYEKEVESGKNYSSLTLTNDSDFYFVGWIGNSYITIEASVDDEDTMKSMIKDMGY